LVPEQAGSAPTTGPLIASGSPHELLAVGAAGTTWASLIHATVELPAGGSVNVGGVMVYVYTHCAVAPVQSVYVHVYVFVPEHTGSAPTTGPEILNGSPQELFTTGGVGTTWASLIQATVDPPSAGKLAEGGVTVYV
jgi:hypothetical protein